MPLTSGARLGRYQITAQIGAGGMGEVYRASDTTLERTVAIKVLPDHAANDAQFRERFEREARAASALNHPNILTVFDVGRERDAAFLVMELIDGVTLRERIADCALPPREVVSIGAQIADGLAAAHQAGLVHRDLKPDNVMVTRDGRVKILDFGLAKPLATPLAGQHTQTAISEAGMLVGTIGYVAPEQVRGGAATAQSDLFSLGVVLYESATGQRTFSRPTTVETLNAILKEDPPELPATVPMGLRQIIAHCLEKEPGRRFQTAADVAFALRAFASTTTVSALSEVETTSVRGRIRLYSATAALMLAALAAGTYAGARWFQETPLDLSAVRLEPFAVESESESHPAISPDGRSVAYVRGVGVPNVGDIVVKSDSAPAPVVLVRNVAVPYNLFWSRTGDRLYFTTRSRLRSVATIGGDARDELLDVNGGHLSPDGRTFATFKIDGTGQVQFVVGPREALRPYDPPMHGPMVCFPSFVRFSPDGSKILLRTTCPENALYVLPVPSADGKGPAPRQLFNGKLDANAGAQWYADSRHIVFASHGSLWLGDSETEALTRLTTSATPAHWPDVGHDGTIAFAEDILDHDVIELPLAGGAPRVLVSSALYDGAAAWAPTTGTFAYVANRGAGDEIRLRSIVDGSEQRLLSLRDFPDAPGDTTQVIRGLTYSPDGQWLAAAVMSLHPSVQAGIWIVPANGGTPRRTTSKDANALQASWSPDGKSMAIQMWDDRLSIVGIGSGEARGVATPAPAVFRHLEWSPTGEWIAASWWRPGTPSTAVLIDPTTGAVRELKEFSAPPAYAWAPDGKTVYGVFLTETGSELRTLDVASGSVKAVAKYTARLRIEDEIIHSLRMVFDARRQSFITTVANDRSNVWLLRGLSLAVSSTR
ncbi:MAG: protein kinase [Vicinamibacterales bacterium]